MTEYSLKCHFPKCKLPVVNSALVTRCSHVFCSNHIIPGEGLARRCPACNTILDGSYDLVSANINPPEESKAIILAGYSPDVIFEIMSKALQFWEFQMNMQIMYQKTAADQLRIRLAKKETQWETMELNIKHYVQAQEKRVNHLKNELSTLTSTLTDIEGQLNEKDRQLRNLQSRYDSLRHQNVASMITKDTEALNTEPPIFKERSFLMNREPVPPTPSFVFRPSTPRNTPCSSMSCSTPRQRPNTTWQ
ncbi:E3 ubiquitin-protein ligase CCNB1IP1-like isoform X2 [Homalodisca vitripennis]|uniref:E3 ubiquitin-protein ligase CCNB1IP1-like isoform X2 n=1 Tax=Homalodisca vitripennis TaxID=197043 RepID=UPI001EEA828E|nr:E3 ubiquitin-protein ligase CCNB1IP1-like isoform X2 [Homalodisca vitripennis]